MNFIYVLVALLLIACGGSSSKKKTSSVLPGGECIQPSVAELGTSPAIEGNIEGSQITASRKSDEDPYIEYFADLDAHVSLPVTVKPYMEVTIISAKKLSGSANALQIHVGIATVIPGPPPLPGSAVAIHIYPEDGRAMLNSNEPGNDNELAFEQEIEYPYTVGIWIDSGGVVSYQDSMGHEGEIGTHSDFLRSNEVVLGVGTRFEQVGEEAVFEINLGEREFKLMPPENSEDFCGNPLN